MIAVGFIVTAEDRQARFQTFADSPEVARRHISYWQGHRSTFLLMGRLYYRADHLRWLIGKIDATDYEACLMSDAALAAALYRESGLKRLARLEGDFVLAAFDESKNRLIALRDPLGNYPLFWLRSESLIGLSTSIRPLIDYLPSAAIDSEYVADYLAFPDDYVSELPTQRTAYRGVQRLLPGWSLEADTSTLKIRCRPYWEWDDRINKIPINSVAEAGQMVRQQLEMAIAERLSTSGRTACHFSGGMDSTGLALLAERLIDDPAQQIEALTLSFLDDPVLAQERQYFESALQSRSALRHHLIPADDFLEWDDHDKRPPLDEPSAVPINYKSFSVLTEAARRAGADTILTGDGADHLFSCSAALLVAELLRKGKVFKAARLARKQSSVNTVNSWAILQNALRAVLPVRLRSAVLPLLKPGRVSFEQMTNLQNPPWFTRDFARRTRLLTRTIDFLPGFEGRPFSFGDIAYAAGDWYNWNIAVPLGILQSRPYFDTRLVALALGIPANLKASGRSMKPVLAAAFDGILPEKIIRRNQKAHFSSRLLGYARHQAWLEHMIWKAPLDEGVIDREVLINCLRKVALGIFRDARSVGRLRMTLTFLVWASDRDSWSAQKLCYIPAESLAAPHNHVHG